MACLRPRFFCCSPFSPCKQGEQQGEQQGEKGEKGERNQKEINLK